MLLPVENDELSIPRTVAVFNSGTEVPMTANDGNLIE
jgi:hypothetical protein